MLNFIALGIYFIFGTKFSWNEGISSCFSVECVLLGRNFDFPGGYLVVTARYLVVTAGYCWLPLVTARSHFQCERVFLYGDSRFNKNKNKIILEATTTYIKISERFSGSLFE